MSRELESERNSMDFLVVSSKSVVFVFVSIYFIYFNFLATHSIGRFDLVTDYDLCGKKKRWYYRT